MLCNNDYTNMITTQGDEFDTSKEYVMLVPRGGCTFEQKAWSAELLGASAIIVYGTLSARYEYNSTTNVTSWPQPKIDYECDNGENWIFGDDLLLNPYSASHNDELLQDDGNLCAKGDDGVFQDRCDSSRCLLSGKTLPIESSSSSSSSNNGIRSSNNNTDMLLYQGCCAWDLHVWMYNDENIQPTLTIQAAYITMEQGTKLLEMYNSGGLELVMYSRPRPTVNLSSVTIWALGTFVTGLASYLSAKEYRRARKMLMVMRRSHNNDDGGSNEGVTRRLEGDPSSCTEYPMDGNNDNEQVVQTLNAILSGSDSKTDINTDANANQARTVPPSSTTSLPNNTNTNNSNPSRVQVRISPTMEPGQTIKVPLPSGEDHLTVIPPMESWNVATENFHFFNFIPSSSTLFVPSQQNQQNQQRNSNRHAHEEESLELKWYHAVLFLLFASASLLILFYFKFYSVVKVMYGVGCSGSLAHVIFYPLYQFLAKFMVACSAKSIQNGDATLVHQQQHAPPRTNYIPPFYNKALFHVCGEPISLIALLSMLSGYTVGIIWTIVSFTATDPSSIPFFWITQNLMGLSICVVFLGVIHLNSIKIATILLLAAFVYDIFFVFITPFLFSGQSIMVTVATSGGPPSAGPQYCEKYPLDKDCQGGDPLPMLFTIPRVGDYMGGASLLGLGDVVLPGLLVSFAARLDAAKRLIAFHPATITNYDVGNTRVIHAWRMAFGGYFVPIMIAYGVGLMMANVAVYLMQMGQPALLYLVPCCLGTMVALALKRSEMGELWRGPKVLQDANKITRGQTTPQNEQSNNTNTFDGTNTQEDANVAEHNSNELELREEVDKEEMMEGDQIQRHSIV